MQSDVRFQLQSLLTTTCTALLTIQHCNAPVLLDEILDLGDLDTVSEIGLKVQSFRRGSELLLLLCHTEKSQLRWFRHPRMPRGCLLHEMFRGCPRCPRQPLEEVAEEKKVLSLATM